jgi:cardiolipin synthase
LLMSIYVALAVEAVLPAAVAILVVSRDVMILGAVVVSWVLDKPVAIKPLFVSKANTAGQIILATAVLGGKAFGVNFGMWFQVAVYTVSALTIASAAAYFVQWLRHMTD